MGDDGSGVGRVAGLYSAKEGQEGGGVLGNTVVRPRRELELTHLPLLTGAVLQQDKKQPGVGLFLFFFPFRFWWIPVFRGFDV